jgi:hypothetical protein
MVVEFTSQWLADQRVVRGMVANPKPKQAIVDLHSERPIMQPDTRRPESADAL